MWLLARQKQALNPKTRWAAGEVKMKTTQVNESSLCVSVSLCLIDSHPGLLCFVIEGLIPIRDQVEFVLNVGFCALHDEKPLTIW